MLCVVNEDDVVLGVSNSSRCGGSPDVTIDELSKLCGSVSSVGTQEGSLLCFCKKAGLTGGRRFVFQLDSSDETFTDHLQSRVGDVSMASVKFIEGTCLST